MSEKYYERVRAIKLNIGFYRKKCGLTQEKLAEKLNISRTHLGNIEAPNMNVGITLDLLFDIADALNIEIVKLFEIK